MATTIGFVVETQCNYFAPLAFPQTVEAGVRVAHAGQLQRALRDRAVREGADTAAAQGHFVHVYVDRADPAAGEAARGAAGVVDATRGEAPRIRKTAPRGAASA